MNWKKLIGWGSIQKNLRIILPVVALVLLLIVFYFSYKPAPASHEFGGHVTSVTDDSIMANGFHTLDSNPSKGTTAEAQDVVIKFDSGTKFIRRIIYIPMPNKTVPNVSPSPVKTKTQDNPGSLTDLKILKNSPIMVKTLNESSNDSVLTASSILYVIVVRTPS